MPQNHLNAIARSQLLLVATDFDGTVSPLVSSPEEARIDPRCVEALARLAAMPRTRVAVISGRPLAWLRDAARGIPGVILFGSHGAEDASRPERAADEHVQARISSLATVIDAEACRWPGCLVEVKPFGVAWHYRRADPAAEPAILSAARVIAIRTPGAILRHGSKVVEFCVSPRHKGEALARAVYLAGATSTIFIGDDITDEDAFAALSASDLAVKVGGGETKAMLRVEDVSGVAELLENLASQRASWLGERALVPIQDHAMLSDHRTLAMVTPGGRITWLCLPRIDSPSIFAELLGGPKAGYFSIESEDGGAAHRQSYLGDSLLLRTHWPSFTVTEYLDTSGGRAFQRAGRSDLVRLIEGRGRVRVRFAPRLDFARTATTLALRDGGIEVASSQEPFVLFSPGVSWRLIEDGAHHTAESVIDLDALGGSAVLELRFGTGNLRPSVIPEPDRRAQTERLWSGWARSLRVPDRRRDLLVRCALTIRALCNGPGGAIAAGGTTSLPEQLGGVRNWDYRFCWPRDAAMAATSLLRLGNSGHAMKLTEWLTSIVDRLDAPERLRPIYAMQGEDLGPEAEISELEGYAGSRPVRIGNAAAQQVQLDVFGPIVHMVASMTQAGVSVSPDAWRLVRAMVHAVEARWEEPDHGIWEIRGPRRHHVHSKVMCWHAVDRALIVHDVVLGRDNPAWRELRDRISADVLAQGWSASAGAFTGSYGSDELDAATLAIGLCGLVPVTDPRWAATVDAINTRLREVATVYRYRGDDGLPGNEGGFVICACWLVQALVTLGRVSDATELFEGVIAQVGPTGLLAEQWDPLHRVALGNVPQAYSHLGVIDAALAIERATSAR